MKTKAPWNVLFAAFTIALLAAATLNAGTAGTPQYQIYDIGVIDAGDDASQGFGVSTGGIGVGRSIRTSGSQGSVSAPRIPWPAFHAQLREKARND
jgi:hypothetical protein